MVGVRCWVLGLRRGVFGALACGALTLLPDADQGVIASYAAPVITP